MYLVQPYVLKSLNTRYLVWQLAVKEKCIFLTFDDGPIPELTPFVLQTLKDFNAKATFFCVGDNVRKYGELFEQIKADGHAVGNHTFNHIDGWKNKFPFYIENVEKSNQLINSKLFRPPYGHLTPAQIKELQKKYYIICWSVLSGDYDKETTPARCLRNVVRNAKCGDIVVFHENKKAIPRIKYALPRFLEEFSKKGFRFESLNEKVLDDTLSRNFLNRSDGFFKKVFN